MALRIFGFWTLLVALIISGVAAYYSIIGLVAIFAAAFVPIVIMGAALEVGKLTSAVWLHTFWDRAHWSMKYYLSFALLVLMFITSMGIFGFLSKAHIEQTSASQESVEQVQRVSTEISRLEAIIIRSEEKIEKLETSGTGADANIQAQIDKEQERIDKAFTRIQPAIDQQNKIIADARSTDNTRTKPYEDQLTSIQAEIQRLETTAKEYETTIAGLSTDNSAVQPLLLQIQNIQQTIVKVEGQIASGEREQVMQAQTTIGSIADGSVGPRTRAAANAWIEQQKLVINGIQEQVSKLRAEAKTTVDEERVRLGNAVKDIREVQIPKLKERELTMLGKIDDVRATESPVIATARDEIQRLRESAEKQVENSQALIDRLRAQLGVQDNADAIDDEIDQLNAKIKKSNNEIDSLTEKKYELQAEYRKLEAEVGPIKYIAEFIYGSADKNLLEEAVRWVIVILVLVFDPLAVVLVLAGITLIKWRPEGYIEPTPEPKEELKFKDVDQETLDKEAEEDALKVAEEVMEEDKEILEKLASVDDQSPNPFAKDFFTEEPEKTVIEEPAEEEKREVIEESTEPEEEKAVVTIPESNPDKRGSFAKDATEWDGLYEDEDGYYTVDSRGDRNYAIDPDQEKVNRKAAQLNNTQQQIDRVVARMKDEGMWPNPPAPTERPSLDQILESDKSGELERILDKADDDTLAQVYQAILSDMKLQPNRKSE